MNNDLHYYEDYIILEYRNDSGIRWIHDAFEKGDAVSILSLKFKKDDLYNGFPEDQQENVLFFVLAKSKGDYYEIKNHIFQTKYDVLVHNEFKICKTYFENIRKLGIFKLIEDVIRKQIIVCNSTENTMPVKVFRELMSIVPSQREMYYYKRQRISNFISEYIDNIKDYGYLYENHLNKKNKKTPIKNLDASLANYEEEKYRFVFKKLQKMLRNYQAYTENDWQNEIIQIVTLLFPKYVTSIKELRFKETTELSKNRKIDIALFDVNGNIDVIEIKKPADTIKLLHKIPYRDNYIPSRHLSGAIMQAEKYIFHLNRMGIVGEKILTEKYDKKLSMYGIKIRITKPKGIIIMGRSHDLSEREKLDFEVIRRKYDNIVDIITYDDLLHRIESLIKKFSQARNNH